MAHIVRGRSSRVIAIYFNYSGNFKTTNAFHTNGQFRAELSTEKGRKTGTTYVGNSLSRDLRFDDYQKAFQSKSRLELARSIAIIKMCTNDTIVDNSFKLMNTGRRVLGNKLFDRLAKPTVYGQFVGGDSPESLLRTVVRMRKMGVGPLVAVAMEEDTTDDTREADQKYDRNLATTLQCLEVVSGLKDPHPMMQTKLTAMFPAKLCEKISQHVPHPSQNGQVVTTVANGIRHGDQIRFDFLSEDETADLNRGLSRIRKLCEAAVENGVIMMVDAEYTYLNPALNLLTLAMMLVCNGRKTLVYYTYQNYLKGMTEYLQTDMTYIHSHGVGFGTKLVRGAYIDKERRLAQTKAYPDPTNATYRDTSDTYHRSMNKMLENIAQNPDTCSAIIASHNEDTVAKAINRIMELQIDPKCGSIFFGQSYGMSDHVTNTLSEMKMPVYKSIPYGSVEDTLAYLSRRAMENRSVLERAQREKTLMWKALKARK
ncbi:hydroxyproline dehydrogenase-like [Mizuhopecten yessoensis]|uniref:Proline dehydrogenase n=1 Tax=Mizuhopecten yessoensis TaxID=6573 RepID=A0A210R700_MIZYE|nr:hydroxyproline dehydrogenase-like [Mizuhopecten yessoensis]OWF56651.1 proline dehydrogenase 2 [Mizuhopecten yessoensis]